MKLIRNRKGIGKRIVSFLIILILLLGFPMVSIGSSSDPYYMEALNQSIGQTGAYLIKTIGTPTYGSVGGDWSLIGLARSEMKLPEGYVDSYYKNVETILKEQQGNLTRNKYSEYSRLILALTSIGKDPIHVAGYDLTAKLADLEPVKKQGINGPIYALLALDSLDYPIPQKTEASVATTGEGTVRTTREELLKSILEKELSTGGFALSGSVADPDVTAAALQALSNYSSRREVKEIIERALAFLSSVQTSTGGFSGWSTSGTENTESIVQVLLALTSLGVNPAEDSRFTKTDEKGKKNNPLDALEGFRLQNGSYRHIPGGDSDLMATEQALLALVSYQRLLAGKEHLFRMGDVAGLSDSEGANYEYKILLNGKYLTFDQPPTNRKGRILVPMRAIFEALGADVEWNNDLRNVTGIIEGRQVRLAIGDNTAYVNGVPVSLDVPAVIEGGRTLVPVRFISESLDAEVTWDGKTNTAIIIKE